MEGVTEGRIVHYVYRGDENGVLGHNAGQHRAAMIVRLFEKKGGERGTAQLLVFPDGLNDLTHDAFDAGAQFGFTPPIWRTSILHDPEGSPGTWHWIEKA